MNWNSATPLAGCILAGTGAFMLLLRRDGNAATKVLAGLLAGVAGLFAGRLGFAEGWPRLVLLTPYWGFPIAWLLGPSILLYTDLSLFHVSWAEAYATRWAQCLPAVGSIGVHAIMTGVFPEMNDPARVQAHQGVLSIYSQAVFVSVSLWGLAFVALALRRVRKYRIEYETRFADGLQDRTQWLRLLLFAAVGVSIFQPAAALMGFAFPGSEPALLANYIGGLPMLFTVLVVLQHLINRPQVFMPLAEALSDSMSKAPLSAREESHPEEKAKSAAIAAQLLQLMESQSPYLDEDLNLQMLSEQLGVPLRPLSTAINREFGTNFYGLVNGYRVKVASLWLSDSENADETILDIAFRAGFNSKASFNRVFKEQTGLTPSEFRRRAESHRPGVPSISGGQS